MLIFSCCQQKSDPSRSPDYKSEIIGLSTQKEKDDYLYQLWYDDQHFRDGKEGKIVTEFGHNSIEHKAFKNKWRITDSLVFSKLHFYLKTHGYPKNRSAYHELSINAIPIIIGHHKDYSDQAELLPYLYRAYKNGKCELDDVVWVLGEMYESKYRKGHYRMKLKKYTIEDEFDEVVAALGMDLTLE